MTNFRSPNISEPTSPNNASENAQADALLSAIDLAVAANREAFLITANGINRADLTELKIWKNAPPGVLEALTVVLSIVSHSQWDKDWDVTHMEASDQKFVAKLKAFNPNTVTEKDMERYEVYEALENREMVKLSSVLKMLKWLDHIVSIVRRVRLLKHPFFLAHPPKKPIFVPPPSDRV